MENVAIHLVLVAVGRTENENGLGEEGKFLTCLHREFLALPLGLLLMLWSLFDSPQLKRLV